MVLMPQPATVSAMPIAQTTRKAADKLGPSKRRVEIVDL
jgi:hypothetical protein